MDILLLYIGFAVDLVADALAPVMNPRDPAYIIANRRVANAASLASPALLLSQATSTILVPHRCIRSNPVLTKGSNHTYGLIPLFRGPVGLVENPRQHPVSVSY